MSPHLRKEIMKADIYKARLKFLQENNITTADDLTACLQQAENEVTQLAKQRTILNVRKKKHKKLFDALAAEAAFAGFELRKTEYDDAKMDKQAVTIGDPPQTVCRMLTLLAAFCKYIF